MKYWKRCAKKNWRVRKAVCRCSDWNGVRKQAGRHSVRKLEQYLCVRRILGTLALIKQLTGYEPQPQALTADQISTVEIGYVVQR